MSDFKTNFATEKRPNGTLRVCTLNQEPTMAQQQFKDECDINNIMKRYSDTGQISHLTSKRGVYGDFSEIQDYQGMLDTVRFAQEAFLTLPAEVRQRFRNDPGYLLDFLQDPKNRQEAETLGLLNKKELIAEPINKNDIKNDNKKGEALNAKKTTKPSKLDDSSES